jgi:hypothetical protein
MNDEERAKEIKAIKMALLEVQAAVHHQAANLRVLMQQFANLERALEKIERVQGGGESVAGGGQGEG